MINPSYWIFAKKPMNNAIDSFAIKMSCMNYSSVIRFLMTKQLKDGCQCHIYCTKTHKILNQKQPYSIISSHYYLQVLQNIDELFDREEFSAAPDPGWPDCFNSGVFVFTPSEETYQNLLQFAVTHGSFDGQSLTCLI